ncbi:predicted transcriptional regulator [Salinicoccus kekensis]|uniref:Predicted transcriptional regulator n=2 Tax=Salinicoccus kekensis TaxID=714307 RepID=A0A285UFZ5_9STAP|nr:predicted transcriptional regulator [Salinicoccus kekensis]
MERGDIMTKTKAEKIIEYIKGLPEGTKISVRQVSSHLGVSEGTSYRAIKLAEEEGLVKTIERVGTIRVIKKEDHIVGDLTFDQVNRVIQGAVLTGRQYLDREISRFIIGAMRTEEIGKYLEDGAFLIVGNREDAQLRAINSGAGILITGGFGASPEILKKAEAHKVPVISTEHDTFSIASLIHRELYSLSLINEVTTANDLMLKQEGYAMDMKADRSRFVPGESVTFLLDGDRFLGTVESRDLPNINKSNYKKYLYQDIHVPAHTTIQSMRQMMTWHQLNIIPVVGDSHEFLGVVHRREVFKDVAPHTLQTGMSTEEIIDREITVRENELHIKVMPFMTDEFGTLTQAGFMRLVERMVMMVAKERDIKNYHIDSLAMTNLKLVQINQAIQLNGEILDIGDQYIKMEVKTMSDGVLYSKVGLMVQYFK